MVINGNKISALSRKLVDYIPQPFVVLDREGIIQYYNAAFLSLVNYEPGAITGLNFFELYKADYIQKRLQESVGPFTREQKFWAYPAAARPDSHAINWTLNWDADENIAFCSGDPVIKDTGVDNTEPGKENHLLLEQSIFQLNMREDVSMEEVTNRLLTGIQQLYPGALCSILKLQDNTLQHYAAPDLPAEYIDLINGVVPGPAVGSCGTAAATNKVVIVSNTEEDPLWKNYRIAATKFGLKACWSVPIPHSRKMVQGTFAIYYRYCKTPSPAMLQYIERWAQVIGILMENNGMIESMRLLNERHNLAIKATHDMLWDWDLQKNVIFRHQDGLKAIYGNTSNNTFQKLCDWIDRIHPEDRPAVVKQLDRIRNNKDAEFFKAEYRFLRADGVWMHIYDRGYIMKDATGKPVRVIGAAQDITERIETQKQLQQSEEQYRYLFQRNPLPMWIFDPQTHKFLQVNEMAVRHYGYTADEFYSMSIYDIRPSDEHERLQYVANSEKKPNKTYERGLWQHKKKNGELIEVEIFSHVINYLGKKGVLVLVNDVTKNIQLQEQLTREKNKRQQQIMKATINMQEKARMEISHELHDNVNQVLGAAKLYLESIPHAQEKKEEYRNEAINLIIHAIQEIRTLTSSLIPPMLAQAGLLRSIHDLLASIGKVGGLKIDFTHQGVWEEVLESNLQLALYRIIQEQINNIVKYAGASQVKVFLFQDDKGIQLCLSDNGVGFEPSENQRGVGFTNIINRSTAYNGKVDIESSPGNGCSLTVYLEHPQPQNPGPCKPINEE
jgi:PAS domain S-box-containing protein